MYDLSTMTMSELTRLGSDLRNLGASSASMEETAGRIVNYFYSRLIDPNTGRSSMALVRFFKIHDFDELDLDQREFATAFMAGEPIPPGMKCLTLLASRGDESAWNSRSDSRAHKAIPLPSGDLVRQFPMISSLIQQFGLELNTVLKPDPNCLRDLNEKSYNVFHAPVAEGSAYIPAQEEFVKPYGIRSVLGFGGLLPSGDLFTIIMFSKVVVSTETAELLRPMTLNAKIAVLQHDGERIFS